MYASESFESVEIFLEAWQSARPYVGFPPKSAGTQERAVFISNLDVLLGRLRNQYSGLTPASHPPRPVSPLVQRVLQRISEAYADPDLSLDALSNRLAVSRRHLCRK